MPNIIEDVKNLVVANTSGNTWSSAVSSTAGLTTVDLNDAGADRISVAIFCTTVTGAGNVTFKVQQSIDGTTWTDLTDNLGNTVATTAFTAVQTYQVLSFNVVQRYVRLFGTLNSGTSINVVSWFIAQQKYLPSDFGGWVNDNANYEA
jgi:hypothetical protein